MLDTPDLHTAGSDPNGSNLLRVLCWVAGGPKIGMGHVVRSLELARGLETAGLVVMGFVCNEDLCSTQMITAAGRRLWTDVAGVLDNLPLAEIDMILVDRPGGPDAAITALRAARPGLHVAALDSFDMETGGADLVINLINHHPTFARPRNPQVDYYEGPAYAIIRQEFLASRPHSRRMPPTVKELVVSFGGADPSNHTGMLLDALADKPLPGITARIVIGPNFSRGAEVSTRARSMGIEVLERVTQLASWFGAADVAVSGGGTTMLELACLGTPNLVVPQTMAEARFAESLERFGAVQVVSAAEGPPAIRRCLDALIDNELKRSQLSAKAREVVDGLGQNRIADLLLARFTRLRA